MCAQEQVRATRLTIAICGSICWEKEYDRIRDALTAVPGVSSVHINPETEMVYLRYSATNHTFDEITSALTSIGIRSGGVCIRPE